ncbi:hypothetical protein CsatA_006635 [Cannabis sativa]
MMGYFHVKKITLPPNILKLTSCQTNVILVGIQGCDEREGSNPSWFNQIEASKVAEIIRKLVAVTELNKTNFEDPYWDMLLRHCSDNNSYQGCPLPEWLAQDLEEEEYGR